MQDGIGGTASARHAGDSVVKGGAGADITRAALVAHGIHYDLAATIGNVVFALVDLRDGGSAHRRKADQFHNGGHSVSRVLAAAGAGSRTGMVFNLEQLLIGNAAGVVRTHGLEDFHDGD